MWQQDYSPVKSVGISAAIAIIPTLFYFVALVFLRLKGHVAASLTAVLSILVATTAYRMPVDMAFVSAFNGIIYGLLPISWIIINALFLYKLTVKSGQFEVIRFSVTHITDDKRLQVLMVGFCFGAFLEGASGYGAPVAITASLLMGLGFDPMYASGLCLIANSSPVAFGALGIPIIVAAKVSQLDPLKVGAMVGRQLPFLSFVVPFWLVAIVDGWRGIKHTWPAVLVVGGTFALVQYLTSNFVGPELPDVASALASFIALALFLRVWKPNHVVLDVTAHDIMTSEDVTAHDVMTSEAGEGSVASVVEDSKIQPTAAKEAAAMEEGEQKPVSMKYSMAEVLRAWSPFIVLIILVTIWTLESFKDMLSPPTTIKFEMPRLHKQIEKMPPISTKPTPMPAVFTLDLVSTPGTAIFLSGLISMYTLRVDARSGAECFGATLKELRLPIVTICSVLAFAFVTNYSGMSSTLALILSETGKAFPFFSPILGWLGVFLTGSDTSSNAFFSSLQAATAHQIGVSDYLLVAANSSGGVTGKMISPQSIAVACAVTNIVGKESGLFRFTLKHSLAMAVIIGGINTLQAYVLTGMLVT